MALDLKLALSIRDTLFAGQYNLLLGAGAALGGKDALGQDMPTGEGLRQHLVNLTGLNQKSSLARAYKQLSPAQVEKEITKRFTRCQPGKAALLTTEFYWRRIYTFNVDDCFEVAYAAKGACQRSVPLTHRSPYIHPDDLSSVQIAHVHGWAHIPDDGYTFSLAEYAEGMGPGNPWVNVLAQTIANEPFIVAGATLEEADFEYFIQKRTLSKIRSDRGPSILVDPFPDPGVQTECDRHGLILYTGTWESFLEDLSQNFKSRPLPISADKSLGREIFTQEPSARDLAFFSQDFTHIAAEAAQTSLDVGFYVGRSPSLQDIALDRDVARRTTSFLKNKLRTNFKAGSTGLILLTDNAGSGKSTLALRALYDLAGEGVPIFSLKSTAYIDLDLCAKVFQLVKGPFVIYCDNIADNISPMMELYRQIPRSDFWVFGIERSYRARHVKGVAVGTEVQEIEPYQFDSNEALALIAKMDDLGLTAERIQPQALQGHARSLIKEPIAVAVCRILNNFRPIEAIVSSLLEAADQKRLYRYVASALSAYCYRGGISRTVLCSVFDASNLNEQMNPKDVLPLAFSDPTRRDYLIPLNPTLGFQILNRFAIENKEEMVDIFCAVGSGVSSYINRVALRRRTAETKLAGRLFDYDEVVKPFLGVQAESFYLRMQKQWNWNSRYWEQLALYKLDMFHNVNDDRKPDFMAQAVAHARHAVRLEEHPFPLTTLGKILLEEMKFQPEKMQQSFNEAFQRLSSAASKEEARQVAIHPYMMLFHGALYFISNSGVLERRQKEKLVKMVDNAASYFGRDTGLMIAASNLKPHIQPPKAS